MPYESQAQRGKFHAMEARGEISPKVVSEFDRASRGKKLPKHKKPLKKISPTSSQVHVSSAGEEDEVLKDKLTTEGREHVAEHNFAIPEDRKYPIHDVSHARNALARVSQHGSAEEKARVRGAVFRKYPSLKPVRKADGPRRVATVAVRHGNHLLMGKRRDNGKWTTPGGHLDPTENFTEGALRELFEETGITTDPGVIKELDEVNKLKDQKGGDLHVQPFSVEMKERPKTSMREDPDAEVHRWKWVDISEGLPEEIAQNLHTPLERNCLMKALGLQKEVEPDVEMALKAFDRTGDQYEEEWVEDSDNGLTSFQLLLEGMDWELVHTTTDPEMAKDTALEQLKEDPFHYRKLTFQEDETDDKLGENQEDQTPWEEEGLSLDLGSGQTREPGHIGLDLYPYDHGTFVHDINLGLPVPDSSCKQIRLCNIEMEDIKPLLSEIHRVLMPEGQFIYEGPEDIYNYPSWAEDYPGLVLTHHEDSKIEKEGPGDNIYRQVFTRIATPDPATADDAEPRIGVRSYDMLPPDALLAMNALDYEHSDATSSGRGNRVHGYPSQGALTQKESDSSGAGDSNQKVKSIRFFKAEEGLKEGEPVALNPTQDEVHRALNPVNPNPAPPIRAKRISKIEKILKKERIVPILKANASKQIVYGVVLAPNEIDAQEDFMTPEDIEYTAHRYLQNSRVIGSSHSKGVKAYPVESFIAPQDFECHGQYGNQEVKKGSWVLGVKIEDPAEWQKVLEGDYTGFSVGGLGARQTV